jgi:signal transduction histidine kinase
VSGSGELANKQVQAERRRIAALLHDGPIQELTAAHLLLNSAIAGRPDTANDPVLQQGLRSLEAAVESCRALMQDLVDEDDGEPGA